MGFPKYDYLSSVRADKKVAVLHCFGCGRRVLVDIPAIIRRYGNIWLVELSQRARCMVCGRKRMEVTVEPPWSTDRIATERARNERIARGQKAPHRRDIEEVRERTTYAAPEYLWE